MNSHHMEKTPPHPTSPPPPRPLPCRSQKPLPLPPNLSAPALTISHPLQPDSPNVPLCPVPPPTLLSCHNIMQETCHHPSPPTFRQLGLIRMALHKTTFESGAGQELANKPVSGQPGRLSRATATHGPPPLGMSFCQHGHTSGGPGHSQGGKRDRPLKASPANPYAGPHFPFIQQHWIPRCHSNCSPLLAMGALANRLLFSHGLKQTPTCAKLTIPDTDCKKLISAWKKRKRGCQELISAWKKSKRSNPMKKTANPRKSSNLKVFESALNPSSLIMIILLAQGTSALQPAGGQLTVYDVSGQLTATPPQVKTISLVSVSECSRAKKIYADPITSRVQILKRLPAVSLQVLHCKLELSVSAAYCGSDGFYARLWKAYPIEHRSITPLTGDQCDDLQKNKMVTVRMDSKDISLQIPANMSRVTAVSTTEGERNAQSSCTGVDFEHAGKAYTSSVKIVTLELAISKTTGLYDPEERVLGLERENLVLKPHQLQKSDRSRWVYGTDLSKGTFAIHLGDLPDTDCSRIEELYLGQAEVFHPENITGSDPIIVQVTNR